MNGRNLLQNDQPKGVDFRPQVLVSVALLLIVASLVGPRISRWFADAGEQIGVVDQYVWISHVDGTSGLYYTDEVFVEGESGPVAIQIKEDGQIVQSEFPAWVAPFFFLPVSLNRADTELLMTLPGIGPKLAERIIALREERGRIESVDQLLQIHGISSRKLASLAPLVQCD